MANKTFNGVKVKVAFTPATSRANIATGENISNIFGKISKWYSSFNDVVWTGDADTVSGFTVGTDVPADAKFTDTVYTHPASAGNKHIPSGGSSGQILKWSASGTAKWATEYSYTHPASGVTAGTYRSVTVDANGHVTSGSNPTITIAQGGTGATTANAAAFNLIGSPVVSETALSDDIKFAFYYATPSTSNGALYAKKASSVWTYIKTKTDVTYAPISHKHSISDITNLQTTLDSKLDSSLKGAASGLAELDSSGKVPSSQLPSYVDDVIEGYLSSGKFYKESSHTTQITGESGKIYLDLSTAKVYRWSGSSFVIVSDYTHPTSAGNKHIPAGGSSGQFLKWSAAGTAAWSSVAKSDVGLGNVENKSSATIRGELTKANVTTALGYTPPTQDTVYTHPSYTARTGVPTANQTPAFGGTFTVSQPVSDATGHITAINSRTITIPSTAMTGATASAAGTKGLVPAPAAGKQTSFLRGDGTWAVPTDTNTDVNVRQSTTNAANYRPLVFGYTNSSNPDDLIKEDGSSVTNSVYVTNKIYAKPSTGELFVSGLSLLTDSSKGNLKQADTESDVTHTFPTVSGTVLNTGNYMDYDGHLRQTTMVNDSSTPTDAPWYKIASLTSTVKSSHAVMTMAISDGLSSNIYGILYVKVASSSSEIGKHNAGAAKWLVEKGIPTENFVVTYTEIPGTRITYELWCKIPTQWHSYIISIINEGSRTTATHVWELSKKTTVGVASYGTPTGTIVSTVGTVDNPLGIKSNTNDSENYVFFNDSTTSGKLGYDSSFVFNPSTNTMYVTNAGGTRRSGYGGNGMSIRADSSTTWACGINYYTSDGETQLAGIGSYGTANMTSTEFDESGYLYMGKTYNNPWLKVAKSLSSMYSDFVISKTTPVLTLNSGGSTEATVVLKRNGSSWRMMGASNGVFKIQNNWDPKNGVAIDWEDVLLMSTDNSAEFTSTVTATKFIGPLQGNADTATTASKLSNTTAIGSATNPVYFNASGVPVKTTYTLGASVPAGAKFTDTVYTHPASGVTAGTYSSVTVNANGHVTSGSNPTWAIERGGTGGTTPEAASHNILKDPVVSETALSDDIKFAFYYASPTTSTGALYAKKASSVWTYIKGKADSVYAASSHGTHVTFSTTTPKANGTAAVGTATTVSRSDHVHPLQTTVSGNAGTATKLATARTIDGFSFDGSANINHYATCSTAAATVAKVATINTGTFTLATGATVYVKFTNANTATAATLNVNSTGAKPIFHNGAAISASSYIKAGGVYQFVYDGTNWVINAGVDTNTTYSNMTAATSSAAGKAGLVPAPAAGKQTAFLRGDGTWAVPTDTNTDTKVTQTATSTAGDYEALFAYSESTDTETNTARKNSAFVMNPSTRRFSVRSAAGTNSRQVVITASGIQHWASSEAGWAGGLSWYDVGGTNGLATLGCYGSANPTDINYFYIGKSYDNPWFKITPSDDSVQAEFNGSVTATSFSGSGASLTSLNASNLSSGTVPIARIPTGTTSTTVALGNHTHSNYYNSGTSRTANTVLAAPNGSDGTATFRKLVAADLPTSGVTAATYGESAAKTATHGGTISIPKITVDNKGRVTSASNITVTLPADNNTDTKVTSTTTNPTSETTYYGTFVTGATTGGVAINDGLKYMTLEGTTSTPGYGILKLGNNISSATSKNKYGALDIYSTSTSFGRLKQADVSTYVTHTLPAVGGTVLNTGNYMDYNGHLRQTVMNQPSASATTAPWYKIASYTTKVASDHAFITLAISSGMVATQVGILHVKIATANTAGVHSSCTARWIACAAGITPSDFIVTYTESSGASLTYEIWCKLSTQWRTFIISVINEGTRTQYGQKWVLSENTTTGSATYGTPTGFVESIFTTLPNSIETEGSVIADTMVATTFSGTASKVASAMATPTSSTSYAIAIHSGNTAGSKSLLNNAGIRCGLANGVADSTTPGLGYIYLGNNKATGTADNQQGGILMYSDTTYAGYITAPGLTARRDYALPNATGTLALTADANKSNYGKCSTAAATAAKTVTVPAFTLATGAEVTVKFTVTNTASSPTLNVNSTGAKPIYYRGSAISSSYLAANRTYTFRYNGTQYELTGDINTNTNTYVTQTDLACTPKNNVGLRLPILLGSTSCTDNNFIDDRSREINCDTVTSSANMTGLAWVETNNWTTGGDVGNAFATICANSFKVVGSGGLFDGAASYAHKLSYEPTINGVTFAGNANIKLCDELWGEAANSTATLEHNASDYDLLWVETNSWGSHMVHTTLGDHNFRVYATTPYPTSGGSNYTIIGTIDIYVKNDTTVTASISNIQLQGTGTTVSATNSTRTITITRIIGIRLM